MTGLLSAAEMRACEAAAMAAGAVTGGALMARAGAGVVAQIAARWPQLAGQAAAARAPQATPGAEQAHAPRVVVLCGPGNNGGDGFVIARLMHDAGWHVAVHLYGDAGRLPGDARAAHDAWAQVGAVTPWDPAQVAAARGAVFVDALFGTGLTRPLPDAVARPLRALHGMGPMVAVDAPSGLCLDSGRVLGEGPAAVQADLTVTFHARKLGHVLGAGPTLCGAVRVVDIGLAPDDAGVPLARAEAGVARKGAQAHKYDHGHALVLAGGPGQGGAARLAARAALRVGAGAVTLGCAPAALPEHAAQLTAIMLRVIDGPGALAVALEDKRVNALCLGPALGTDEAARALVAAVLTQAAPRPTVLDADALTLLARDDDLRAALHDRCVLTPHMGEFARLFPDLAERLEAPAQTGPAFSRRDAARAAAARCGAVVVLKGPDTVIAAPDGACAISDAVGARAAPWLATAGAGDVLAGLICGAMARGLAPFAAAQTGVWLHVEAARAFGPGLIAEDLPEAVPGVLRALAARADQTESTSTPSA